MQTFFFYQVNFLSYVRISSFAKTLVNGLALLLDFSATSQISIHVLSIACINYCRRLKGIHSRSDTNRIGAKGLSFYYPRLLHCLNQMLAVVLLSQHRVSSSKIVRPCSPCGARCIGHAVRTWLRFAQRRHTCNSVKERDPICAWTNGIAQHQSAGG